MLMQANLVAVRAAAVSKKPRRRQVRKVVTLVARQCEVSKDMMLNDSRGAGEVARARQLAMYLAHVVLGERMTDIGMWFGRDRTTVSHACHVIEDLREDGAFDAEVCRLEATLDAMGVTYRG